MPYYPDHIDPGNAGGSVSIPRLAKIPPRPVSYPCAECKAVFTDIELLRRHRLDDHPIQRPYLYLVGKPHHLDHYVVTRKLGPSDLQFINAGRVSVDGGVDLDQAAAAKMLSKIVSGRVRLNIESSGYSVSYILDFQLMSDEVALKVEKIFLECTGGGGSHANHLTRFNKQVQEFDSSALGYAAALDRYLVGIMAKDRVQGCSIPYEEFVERLGESLERLEQIGRPLSDTVISLIRLILNDFPVSSSEQEIPAIAATVAALREGELVELDIQGDSGSVLPVDELTEMVIEFATRGDTWRSENYRFLESLLQSHKVSDLDRHKLHLLLMAWYGKGGDTENIQRHYSKIRHVHRISDHAKRIFERYGK